MRSAGADLSLPLPFSPRSPVKDCFYSYLDSQDHRIHRLVEEKEEEEERGEKKAGFFFPISSWGMIICQDENRPTLLK